MALINELIKVDEEPRVQTGVSADYCFTESIFQIRSYKNGDIYRKENSKQNIQFTKEGVSDLIKKLNTFLNQ